MNQIGHTNGETAALGRAPPAGRVAETKHERFLRLAPPRVQRALDALRWVAKLSVPENEYSEHEMEQIVTALQLQVDEVERRLARRKPEKPTFAFD